MKKLIIFLVFFLSTTLFYCKIDSISHDIILKAELEKEVISIDESLMLNIEIINPNDSIINILTPPFSEYPFKILLKQGGRDIKPPTYTFRGPRTISLNPNETYKVSIDINRMFSRVINSGDFQISIQSQLENTRVISFNNLSFEILPPTTLQLQEKELYHNIISYDNDKIVEAGKAFIEKYPNSKYLARVVMSTSNSLRQLEQYDEALKCLEQVFESSNKIEDNDKNVILHKMADLYFHKVNQKEKAFEILDSLEGELAERKKAIWKLAK